jgi:c-di-GMP-binding flagellar brake protein YcgR
MTEVEMTESREHLRVDAKVTISYLGPTKNLSAGGMCVMMESPLAVGAEPQIEFTLPDDPNLISCTAQVVWSEKARSRQKTEVGLVFMDISSEDKARIEDFVQRHSL